MTYSPFSPFPSPSVIMKTLSLFLLRLILLVTQRDVKTNTKAKS